jgi:hypothetical protein
MRAPKHFWIPAALLLASLAGCSEDSTGPDDSGGEPARVVLVGPAIVTIDKVEANYRALALEEDGTVNDVTDRAVWSSDDESIFTVEKGTITILQGGLTHLRARVGNSEGKLNLSLVVRQTGLPLPEISGDEHLPLIRQSTQLTATMSFLGQFDVDVSQDVLWQSSDPTVLNVDIYGLVTAVGNGEAYITANYGNSPGTLPIIAGPMPAKSFDISVVAIRLNADAFCENSDEGDAEFSYDFYVTTSTGEQFVVAATDDYPSSADFDLMADDAGSTGLLNIVGEADFVLTEIQSFMITGRVTEWDHEFYYFGDWVPDPNGDDLRDEATHRGSSNFDEGLHELSFGGAGGDCNLKFEYRIVVTER